MADALLPALAAQMTNASWEGAGLALGPPPGMITLRLRTPARNAAAQALGLAALPEPNDTAVRPALTCYWIRPDEWLVVVPLTARDAIIELLEGALAPFDAAVLDTSGSRHVLQLAGPASRAVLASCCALDTHARVFAVGRCAQSLIAKAPMLLHLVNAAPTWRILVRPTLLPYVADWLMDGMAGARAEAEGRRGGITP